MKKAIVMLLSAALLMMALASCKVYSEDCSEVYENNGVVYDQNIDYNHNGLRGADDEAAGSPTDYETWQAEYGDITWDQPRK